MSEDQPPGSPEPKLKAERTKSLAAHTTSVPLPSDNSLPNTSQLSRGTSLRVREKTPNNTSFTKRLGKATGKSLEMKKSSENHENSFQRVMNQSHLAYSKKFVPVTFLSS